MVRNRTILWGGDDSILSLQLNKLLLLSDVLRVPTRDKGRMTRLLVQAFFITQVLILCAAEFPLSEDTLDELSEEGEHFIDEEIKRAVLGMKQVKELMEEKEEKHRHFMDALRQSSDKKKGAMQLAGETEQKLEEAERQCRDLTKSSFEECRPCLVATCKDFYTSTCRRGFTSFSYKVEEFFKTLAAQLEDTDDYYYYENEEIVGQTNLAENHQVTADEAELQQVEASFSQLLAKTNLLFNQSIAVVRKMQFENSFLSAFMSDIHPSQLSSAQVAASPGFLGSLGLDHIVDSVYEFGRSVMGELRSTVGDVFDEDVQEGDEYFHQQGREAGSPPSLGRLQSRHLCRRLRRQTSECQQLQSLCETCKEYLSKECPIVQQLQSDVEEMQMLLNASSEQYDDRLQLVRRHTADTQKWLGNMEDKYRWVSRLSNITGEPQNIFSVLTVTPQQQVKNVRAKAASSVVVTVLDSAPITVVVPADLDVEDPAFVQYAAQEALTLHKRQIRGAE